MRWIVYHYRTGEILLLAANSDAARSFASEFPNYTYRKLSWLQSVWIRMKFWL